MLPALALLLLSPAIQDGNRTEGPAEPLNEFAILQRVRKNVQAELAKSANYTCVETIVRTYYKDKHACPAKTPTGKVELMMRDRLRLDIAVSEGHEIYSWHGEDNFTSANIAEVIRDGPSSSGQFIGFLRNIFIAPGASCKLTGTSTVHGQPVYTFDYRVDLLRSHYVLQGRGKGSRLPFHGSFSADAQTFNLAQLRVIADDIPGSAGICSAETDVEYQVVNIAGDQALLPSSFDLKMKGETDLYTVNHDQYNQCREFRGESTLVFKNVEAGASIVQKHAVDEPLPAGLIFRATLQTPIDDKNSFTGDAVEARLAGPLKIPGTKTVIPKGATLHGVISQMEEHTEGLEYWLFAIEFERLTAGADSYVMNARQFPVDYNSLGSRFSNDRVLTSEANEAVRRGVWFLEGTHFHLPKNLTRYWQTQAPSKEK